MYVHQLSVLQWLIILWSSYRAWHFYPDRLPEAICCCLQICTVDDVFLVMYCMCLLAFIVTSVDKSQLLVYSCYLDLLIYCLRVFVVV